MREYGKLFFYLTLAYLVLPIFFAIVFWKKARYRKNDHPRILVVPVMRRIGDLMCATPVFRAIKMHMPHSHLAVAVGGNVFDLLKHNPRIDEIININDKPFKGLFGRGRFFLRIAQGRFDYVISLPVNPLHNLIAFFSFAPHRIKTIRSERSFIERLTDWWNTRTLLYRDHTYLPAHYMRLLEFLGIHEPEIVKEIFPAPEGAARARAFFEKRGVVPDDFLVGISITAGNKIKEWGDEKFAKIAQKLQEQYRAKIIFVGGSDDIARIQEVISRLYARAAFPLAGIPLDVLPSFMERFNLFIAVDTGPIYIAHALGIPLIDIVGPVDWREQPPEDEKSVLVKPPPPIQPSSFVFKKPGTPAEHERALASVTVEMVMGAVNALMSHAVGNSDSGKRVL